MYKMLTPGFSPPICAAHLWHTIHDHFHLLVDICLKTQVFRLFHGSTTYLRGSASMIVPIPYLLIYDYGLDHLREKEVIYCNMSVQGLVAAS